jgi:hypothetical protein
MTKKLIEVALPLEAINAESVWDFVVTSVAYGITEFFGDTVFILEIGE